MRGLFLLGLCALVTAQNASLFGFSGTYGAATLNPIYLDGSGVCQNDTSYAYYFTTFNFTFATAGVRALFGANIDFVGVVLGNAAFNTQNLCPGNNVFPLKPSTPPSPSFGDITQYGGYFTAATYTFLVAGSDTGAFVGEIWDGSYNGQTGLGLTKNKTWAPLYDSDGSCTQYTSEVALYDTQLVRVASTGYYNVYLTFAQNLNLPVDYQIPSPSPSYVILKGDYTGTDLSTITCPSVGVNYVSGDQGDYLNTQTFRVWLQVNTNYTFVVTAGYFYSTEAYYGSYSLAVTPSRNYQYINSTYFTRPEYGSCSYRSDAANNDLANYACVTNSYAPQPYAITTLSVAAGSQFYLVTSETAADGTYLDQEFIIYDGDNRGLVMCGPIGTHCWEADDSIDGDFYAAGSDTFFTLISSPYFDGGADDHGTSYAMGVYLLSGPGLGVVAATNQPTAAGGTSAPTVAGTTRAPTTAGTLAPTVVGGTRAPTTAGTLAPTVVGGTRAPTSQVSSVAWLHPCLITVFSLIAFLA